MDNIAFCFIVKDGGEYLELNIERIFKLCMLLPINFKIFYAENDSKDDTINILIKLKNNYKNIYGEHLLLDGKHSTELCVNSLNKNCTNRVRRLAFLRNIVLNKAKEWKECDYMIMLDLDFVDFSDEQFYKMFNIIKNNKNINGIFGMSVIEKNNNSLYDLGAVKPFSKIFSIIAEEELVKVDSAFSGFGIYRMKPIIDNNLQYNLNADEIEHIDFNKNINNLYVYTCFRPIYVGDYMGIFFIKYYIKIICILVIIYLFFKLLKKN